MRFPRLDQTLGGRFNMSTAGILLMLTGAGLAGNYLGYEVFFGVHLIFGSIFAMLVLQL